MRIRGLLYTASHRKGKMKIRLKTVALFLAAILSVPALAQNKKIVVFGVDPDTIREFQSVTSNVTIVPVERDRAIEQVADADAIVGTISPELFRADKRLKWVQVYSAGVETYRFPPYARDAGSELDLQPAATDRLLPH